MNILLCKVQVKNRQNIWDYWKSELFFTLLFSQFSFDFWVNRFISEMTSLTLSLIPFEKINKCQNKTCQYWKQLKTRIFLYWVLFFRASAPFLDFRLVSLEQDCHNLSHPVWALKREAADSALASTCQLFCKTYDFLYVTSFTGNALNQFSGAVFSLFLFLDPGY